MWWRGDRHDYPVPTDGAVQNFLPWLVMTIEEEEKP